MRAMNFDNENRYHLLNQLGIKDHLLVRPFIYMYIRIGIAPCVSKKVQKSFADLRNRCIFAVPNDKSWGDINSSLAQLVRAPDC